MSYAVGALFGSLLITFLLSRLLYFLLKKWSEETKKILTVNAASLGCAGFIGGMGMADGSAFVPIQAMILYLPAQLCWLMLDFVRLGKNRRASRRTDQPVPQLKAQADNDEIVFGDENEPPDLEDEDDLNSEQKEAHGTEVIRIRTLCQVALMRVDDIAYGGEQAESTLKYINDCIKKSLVAAQDIHDDFYRCAALDPVGELLIKTGQYDRASKLIELINVEHIQEKLQELLRQHRRENIGSL